MTGKLYRECSRSLVATESRDRPVPVVYDFHILYDKRQEMEVFT